MADLTHDEARRRAATVAVTTTTVQLDLTVGDERFDSRTTLRFRCAEPGTTTWVDVRPAQLRSAILNGEPLDLGPAWHDGRLTFTAAAENELIVDAAMAYSHDGEGLHRHVDPADGRVYTYAMSFLDAAPRWFACFDQPDLKAPVALEVTCPPDWLVAGNGPAEQVAPGRWRLLSTGPLATYFTTLLAGPYHEVRSRHDGIELALHCRQSLAVHLDADAEELFAHTRHCLDALHALFGARYPWGEYHQAFVPEFNAGAMENPGCVTITEKQLFRSRVTDADRTDRLITVAHEMAHMWFGDLVTMRWWDDLWLNESFAEYLGQRVTGDTAWVSFGAARKAWGHAADRRPSTHPVAGNGAADTAAALADFDGISYAKGASVLRQLATRLGDDVFLGGLRRHIAAHAHSNATFADLAGVWTDAGAHDIDGWLTSWLRTTGMDELIVADGELLRRGPTPRIHAVDVASLGPDGTELARRRVLVEAERTPLGLAAGLVLPDAGDDTWAKVSVTDWGAVPAVLAVLADARSRVALWNGLRLAVADAEVDPRVAVDAAVAALSGEPQDVVVARVGAWLVRDVAGAYLPDEHRTAAYEQLEQLMWRSILDAEPGSGRQLAAARVAVAAAVDPGWLRAWLAGDGPPGLIVDRELRWAVLLRLARLGEIGPDDIDAELSTDQSSQGRVHAARARAARPDAAAKATAFTTLLTDPDRPNIELYALAEGFWDPTQRALTDQYVSRFFDEIADTVRLRSGWVVGRLALLLFPWTAVDDDTLDRAQRLLERPELPAGLRRSLVDAGDDLRRAVASRRRFAR